MAKKALIVFLAVTMITAAAFGGGFALSGVGSKAISMGGAFRGLADDWSAAYWNPAGLAQLEQSEFNALGITLNPMPKMTPRIRYNGYEVGYLNDEVRYPQGKTHLAANISGFYKLPSPKGLVFGVAVFSPYALGSRWDLYDLPYSDASEEFATWDHEATLKVIDIHPSLAKSFMNDKLMLGAGLSILYGDIDFQKTVLTVTSLPSPHDVIATDAFLSGTGWGYGANFGAMYKISDKLQVGVSGKTKSKLALDGTVKNTLYTIDNDDLYSFAYEHASSDYERALLDYIFDDEVATWENNVEGDIKLPADIGIGFAYNATPKLTLTMDVTYTMWSNLDSIVISIDTAGVEGDLDGSSEDEMVIRTKWDDIVRLSIGGLYKVNDKLELRGGFYYDPSPIPDETFSPLFIDIGTKYSGNIGAAWKVNNWELAYNFEYVYFSERTIEEGTWIDDYLANYPGYYESYLIMNCVSVTYRF